jgi:hypothetical protein
VANWLPPLDGEEPKELKEPEGESASVEEDDEKTESEERPPPVTPGRKTRLPKQKEEEAAKASPAESSGST